MSTEGMFEMLSAKKRILIPVLALLLVVSMAGTALASMNSYGYTTHFSWSSTFNTLRQGSAGSQVRFLQRVLNYAFSPNPDLVADGDFGPATNSAVVWYQNERGLVADGLVGPATWGDLQSYINWISDGAPHTDSYGNYYQYRSVLYSNYWIRHYANGTWRVQGSNGLWYAAN